MSQTTYTSKRLDHHGIVAGICKQLKLCELIDNLIPSDHRKKVTYGEAVVAMIINCLGFTSRPMYLCDEFFKNKPASLIREDLDWSELNDDCLGRTLDKLFEVGVTEVFSHLVTRVINQLGIDIKQAHLDTSSFAVTGEYKTSASDDRDAVLITRGYSKDHRPDLKQVCLSMICEGTSNIPIWMEALDGNQSDVKSFPETIKRFCQQLEGADTPLIVMDAAFYSKENITAHENLKWVTRVPDRIKAVERHYWAISEDDERWESYGDHRFIVVNEDYAGVEQRWVIVESAAKMARDEQALQRQIEKERKSNLKELRALSKRGFQCFADADQALDELVKNNKFFGLSNIEIKEEKRYKGAGRPSANSPHQLIWVSSAELELDDHCVASQSHGKGRFVIATSCLDSTLNGADLISIYKAQGSTVERGFRFLKDPMFFADSLFLKNPSRIMALMMVMTLSLLVYSVAEKQLRDSLANRDETIPNQSGKPTSKPTMRRVFQMFEGVEVLLLSTPAGQQNIMMNLDDLRLKILSFMSSQVKYQYGIE
mgnify:FL=1